MSAPPLPEASRSAAAQARWELRKSRELETRPFVEATIARGGGGGQRDQCGVSGLAGDWGALGHLVVFRSQWGYGIGFGGGLWDRGAGWSEAESGP